LWAQGEIPAVPLAGRQRLIARLTWEAPRVVWGNADPFFDVAWAYWLRDTIPGVRDVVVLDGAKRFFPDERADELVGHLRTHWAHASAARSGADRPRAPVGPGGPFRRRAAPARLVPHVLSSTHRSARDARGLHRVNLDGGVALVTGAASGIGRATAERLAEEGMRVCVVDREEDGGRAVATARGGAFHVADVGDPAQVDAAFAHCVAELGGLDVAFLNAGIAIGHGDIESLPDDEYRRIMRVNVDGVVFGARAAVRELIPRGGGAIIATASLAGLIPFPPDPVYDLTKHAVVGFIRSLAPTLAAKGITANCVNPGMTDTGILGDEVRAAFAAAAFPLMAPTQIAAAVVHAISSGETGQCWVCQPGREPVAYQFRDVPGPRTESAQGRVPPGLRGETGDLWR
jgi:NAD(P)-dependent dehydrogenase (short-subunit alcohol dehydrogenase family)